MPPIPVVNGDVGEKLANESVSSESLDQSNSFDKTKEPFLIALYNIVDRYIFVLLKIVDCLFLVYV